MSKATVSFIRECFEHALQRHTVTEEIDPIALALDWQYTFTAFHCFQFMEKFLFLEEITFYAHAP